MTLLLATLCMLFALIQAAMVGLKLIGAVTWTWTQTLIPIEAWLGLCALTILYVIVDGIIHLISVSFRRRKFVSKMQRVAKSIQ